MSKGENIFKRKDGRWEARYVKEHEPSGKIKYGYCYGKSYKEAKEKVAKAKNSTAIIRRAEETGSENPFCFYCDEWLQVKRHRVKEATYVKYESMIEKHIKPALGKCHPKEFGMATVEEFSGLLLQEKHLSPKTVRDIFTCLRAILRYVDRLSPGTLSSVDIAYPREEHKEMRVLSPKEQKRLTEYLLNDMDASKFGTLLALLTGLRIGEICSLRWDDINMKEKTIHVHSTMQRLKNTDVGDHKTRIIIGVPKSDKSLRTIPMTDQTALLCARMHAKSRTAFILTGTEQYMEPRMLQYRMKKYASDCNLDGVHFHTLRHTFATRAVEVGFEIKTLSEILGHSSTTVTLDRYVHSSLELKRANMSKLDTVVM